MCAEQGESRSSTMALPSVSVVIPTYNRAGKLRRAVQSVLCQNYPSFEIVVVDDGSTDNTEAVVRAFSDERIRYVRMPTNMGANAARNMGIRAATADFVAFQDSDDEWLADKLLKQMRVFIASPPDVGVVYGGFIRCDGKQTSYVPGNDVKKHSGHLLDELLGGNFVGTPTAIVRRESLLKVGLFDEKLPRLQDWELFIRLARQYRFVCIDEPLVVEYHDADCITSDGAAHFGAIKAILEKHRDVFASRPRDLAQHYYVAGKAACRLGLMHEGIACFVMSLRCYPGRFIGYCRLGAALLGSSFYRFVFGSHD